jgi:OFA family oxalate/formate antiporter-like MFS transporter
MKKADNRWFILASGIVLMLCSGLLFAWSVFVQPIEGELGFSRSQTSLVFTIALSVSIGGQIFAGILASKKSPRLSLLIASALILAGFAGAARVRTLGGLYLFYGVLAGAGIGMSYNTVLATVLKNFPGRSSLATGLLLMGFGLGGMVFGSLATSLMALMGWRGTFLAIAVLFAALHAAGSFILKAPAEKELDDGPETAADVHPFRMIRQSRYLFFFGWAVLISGSALMIIAHAAPCASEIGATAQTAALASGVVSLFNGCSRILFSSMYGRYGHRAVMATLSAILLAGTVAILFAYNNRLLPLLFVGFSLLGVTEGGGPPTVTSFVREKYGYKYLGVNIGITNLEMIAASVLGPMIAGAIRTGTGSYSPAFYALLAFNAIAFLLSFGTGKSNTPSVARGRHLPLRGR